MTRRKGQNDGVKSRKRPIECCEHNGKTRVNNPPVCSVTPETDPPLPIYRAYDYIDPVLPPNRSEIMITIRISIHSWSARERTNMPPLKCGPFPSTFTKGLTGGLPAERKAR